MGSHHRIGIAGAVALCVGLFPGCRRHTHESAPAPSAAPSTVPIDRLAPGELAPGTEALEGLVLPRGMHVSARFPRIGHAAGPLHAEDVENYVRARVDPKQFELGAAGTVFPAVHIAAGDPSKTYRIEVNAARDATELVIHDVTPLPPPATDPSESEADKWKRAGYKPNGAPLDPANQR